MAPGVFTRSVGMPLAIVGTVHLQARELDEGLDIGNRAVDWCAPASLEAFAPGMRHSGTEEADRAGSLGSDT
jgi:hypothetical protein